MTLLRMWVQVLYDSLMGDPYIAPRVPPRLLDLLEYHRTLIFYDDEDEEYFYDNAEQQVQSQLSGLKHVSAHNDILPSATALVPHLPIIRFKAEDAAGRPGQPVSSCVRYMQQRRSVTPATRAHPPAAFLLS